MKNKGWLLTVPLLLCMVSGFSNFRSSGEARTSGEPESIDFENLTAELTEAEKQNPASRYYHDTPTEISEAFLSAVATELTEEEMFYPNDVVALYDTSASFRNGYGVLANGVTYSAVETVMTGVTREIYDQYYSWANSQEDQTLIYKIWYPGYHYAQARTQNGLEIVEDIGQGQEYIQMLSGVGNRSASGSPQVIETYMVNSVNTVLDTGAEIPGVLLHVKYINDDGFVADRCVAWFGCNVVNGELEVNIDGIPDALNRAKGMALHSAGENTNLTSVMLEYYQDSLS